jgi:hypothetical protein
MSGRLEVLALGGLFLRAHQERTGRASEAGAFPETGKSKSGQGSLSLFVGLTETGFRPGSERIHPCCGNP